MKKEKRSGRKNKHYDVNGAYKSSRVRFNVELQNDNKDECEWNKILKQTQREKK